MPTYFFFGTHMPENVKSYLNARGASRRGPVEVASNLFYMGSAGIATIKGLRVAFCGGVWTKPSLSTNAPERADVCAWREPTGTTDGMPIEWSTWDTLETRAASEEALRHLLRHPAVALGEARAPELPRDPESLKQVRAWQYAQAAFEFQQEQDAPALRRRAPIDFLLTNAWPLGIEAFSCIPPQQQESTNNATAIEQGLAPLARLAEACRPRYHIACARDAEPDGLYWEREPYENWPFAKVPEPRSHRVTRFVSLAAAANPSKCRWFLALQVVPSGALYQDPGRPFPRSELDDAVPPTTTPMPLWQMVESSSARAATRLVAASDVPHNGDTPRKKRARTEARSSVHKQRAGATLQPVEPDICWFCLSNPAVEKHLIVSFGAECYIALPKGQLPVSSSDETLVPGGGHVLIVPIVHTPSLYARETSNADLRREVSAWKHALRACYDAYEAVPVCWEVVRRASRVAHAHVQVLPIPKAREAECVQYVREAAERDGLTWESDAVARAWADVDNGDDEHAKTVLPQDRADYFYMEIGATRLLLLLRGERFYLQFARETLATFLGMSERSDWHACARSREVEQVECDEFKEAFIEYAEQVTDT